MQNIDLICVGKLNAPYFAAGVAEYQKRLGAFCNFRIIELPEAAIADTSVVAVSYPVSSAKNPNIERPPIIHAATTNNNSNKFLLFNFLLSIIPPFVLLSQF